MRLSCCTNVEVTLQIVAMAWYGMVWYVNTSSYFFLTITIAAESNLYSCMLHISLYACMHVCIVLYCTSAFSNYITILDIYVICLIKKYFLYLFQ